MNKNLIHEMAKIEKNYWWFVQKRDFIKKLIKIYSKTDSNKKILDCGCGTGENLRMLAKYGEVSGIDFDDDCIEYCNNKGFKNIYKKDLNKQFLLDQKVDLIVATDVLEHLENDKQAYSNIINNLNINGIAVVTVPAHQFLFSKWDTSLHHKRRYSKKNLELLIYSKKKIKCLKLGYYNLQSFFPALISRIIINKLNKQEKSEFKKIPGIVNKILIVSGYLDNLLAATLPFYFGLSLYAVIKKTSD